MALTTHEFLRTHRDKIVREWEALVEGEERLVTLHGSILRNRLPALLDELAAWMEHDAPPGGEPMRLLAVEHATHRLNEGFELTQLIHEVRLLRMTILRLLLTAETDEQAESGTVGMAARVTDLARLNSALDFAITDAAEHFVKERDRRLLEVVTREAAVVRESDQRKSDFLAILSHELRNPLAPILTALHILDQAEASGEHAARARRVIHRQTKHLTRLVDDLLDTTRLSHGKIELHRVRFDLRDVVRSTFDDHRAVFEQGGVALRLDVPAGPLTIDGDPTRIAQVLNNLLNNAAKFTPAGGAVSVAINAKDGHVCLHVRDDGVGMEPAMIEHVFEPFMQGRQDTARQQGGLGLGLALVKGLVELHGGSVSARSGGGGTGSEFVVELPLASAPPQEASAVESATAPPRLVLIIDDNVDAGDTLAEALEISGHRARVARDGKSGIALALDLKPDVVLCDIGLPDVDGYEVARALRANGASESTRLIALTGYAQPEDKRRVQQAGFDAHLANQRPSTT